MECQPVASEVVGIARPEMSKVVPAVKLIEVPLPNPGSVSKNYCAATSFGDVTVNLLALVAVSPETVTVIGPLVADAGTVTVRVVVVATVTVATVPLMRTVLLAGVVEKFEPVMTTVLPTNPLDGLNELIAGCAMVLSTK